MRTDMLAWANGQPTSKRVNKETLNHPGLIELVSGLDVYQHTAEAYQRSYEALGIDLVNRVPLENAPAPTLPDEIRFHPQLPYRYAPLGVYDTVMRHTFACAALEDVLAPGRSRSGLRGSVDARPPFLPGRGYPRPPGRAGSGRTVLSHAVHHALHVAGRGAGLGDIHDRGRYRARAFPRAVLAALRCQVGANRDPDGA